MFSYVKLEKLDQLGHGSQISKAVVARCVIHPDQRRKCPNAVIVKTNLLQILRLKNIELQSMDTKQNTYVSLSIFD